MSLEKTVKQYPNDADLGEFIRNNWSNIEGLYGVTFEAYQKFVESLKVYPEKHSIVYPALGLAGESGEYCEKIKKWLRGDGELDKILAIKELGDILFYVASSASDLGFTIEDVAKVNFEKLSKRKKEGVLHGSGDNR